MPLAECLAGCQTSERFPGAEALTVAVALGYELVLSFVTALISEVRGLRHKHSRPPAQGPTTRKPKDRDLYPENPAPQPVRQAGQRRVGSDEWALLLRRGRLRERAPRVPAGTAALAAQTHCCLLLGGLPSSGAIAGLQSRTGPPSWGEAGMGRKGGSCEGLEELPHRRSAHNYPALTTPPGPALR